MRLQSFISLSIKYPVNLIFSVESKTASTIPDFEQAQRIRFIRQTRVAPEPEIYQESIVASAPHVNLGLIRTSFPKASMMNAVYNWAGSLSDFPVFFELSAKPGTIIFPYMPIADNNTLLLMRERERVIGPYHLK